MAVAEPLCDILDVGHIAVTALAGVAFLGVAYLVWRYSHDGKVKRALENTPRVATTSFVDGSVGRVVGRVQALGPPLSAPLTGRSCVCYDVRVEEYRYHAYKGLITWQLVIREVVGQDFAIQDEHGRALVRYDPSWRVALVRDGQLSAGTCEKLAPTMAAYLERHLPGAGAAAPSRKMRFLEGVVEEGERVAVAGRGRIEPDPDPSAASGYRQTSMRLVLEGSERRPLYLSDDPYATD